MAAGSVVAAAIPAAPLMLPAVAPRLPDRLTEPVEAMRDASRAALGGLGGAGAVLVVATAEVDGPRILSLGEVSLDGLGVSGTTRPVMMARDQVDGLVRATGWRVEPTRAPVDLASLVLQLVAVRPRLGVVPVVLPRGLQPPGPAGVLEAAGSPALLVAGDLSAGLDAHSPRPSIPGAGEFDAAVVQALQEGDSVALGALGPAEAGRVCSRGWLPLAVLLGDVAAPADSVTYRPLRGVGQIVATWRA